MTVRVLLVDDIPMIRIGFATMLNAEPDIDIVGEAGNGRDAVTLARRLQPDVVVMDISMPDLDGLAATEQIIAESAGRTAVLVQTTFDSDENVYAALAAGASGFLLKTMPVEDLARAVRLAADGQALVSPEVTKRLIEQNRVRWSRRSDADERAKLETLTDRERQILKLVASGQSNSDIAGALFLAPTTVKTHITNVMSKLGLPTRAHLVIFAYETGLVTPGP
ncbi:response regulator [Amycolatopsis sp. NPDC049868]|uniref:response regulator n=1 Tax=Amycolatopsis sp. NPDC049868 TaxID=3363934 RepID=UPI0037A4B9E3